MTAVHPGDGPDGLRVYWDSIPVDLVAVGVLPGMAIRHYGPKNGPGLGLIDATGDGSQVTWTAPGSSNAGTAVDVSGGGEYVLRDGDDSNAHILLAVFPSRIVAGPAQADVWARARHDNGIGGDTVTAAEAAAGSVESWTVQLRGRITTLSHVVCWIDSTVSGFEISTDGVSWVAPTDEASALSIGDVPTWADVDLYVQRTIGAGAASALAVENILHFAWDGI